MSFILIHIPYRMLVLRNARVSVSNLGVEGHIILIWALDP